MRFGTKKNTGLPEKHCAISRQEKMAFSIPRQVALGLPSSPPFPPSLYGADGCMLTSKPKFLETTGYQIELCCK